MISIIVAIAKNGIIGGGNTLLWYIKEDLQHFKAITSGHSVIMGRKTFESLGRPLPNRTNVVITRQKDLEIEGVTVVHSLQQALKLFPKDDEVFIIGGAQIYAKAMEIADKFYLTKVYRDYQGDTLYPDWDENQWEQISSEYFQRGEKFESPFEFIEYTRCRSERKTT